MQDLLREILRYADRLAPQHWLIVLAMMIVIGLLCLRGFGSRSKY